MFEKFESWTLVSPGPPELFTASWNFWSQRGYRLMSTGPASFQGRSFYSRLGLYRVVDVTVVPAGTGAMVQFRYRADVSEAGAVGGVVAAVILFPVAVVGGAISWHQYETDFENERWAFWNYLTAQMHVAPAANTVAPLPPPPEATPVASAPAAAAPAPATSAPAATPAAAPLPSGGSPAPTGSCPACGKPLAGEGKFCHSCGAKIG
ncbi:MAG: zinc ribbon domain-containing protein [Euryarchaeota archaeon]|nr:zinc ribbon domain-containing protein [Euryarchaeota archaeon]MDE1835174.1 zinc ribbon domain-containing protein [Euryarchaeota archaeon]MDE1880415.1 zinc ribbon domain-containing protein [Euryarchaeota archaeon]MDE2045716.1 zinc ribbon domain-containing protein [Thermoplasmata archaeon]